MALNAGCTERQKNIVQSERSFIIILTTLAVISYNDKLIRTGKEFRTRGINFSSPGHTIQILAKDN